MKKAIYIIVAALIVIGGYLYIHYPGGPAAVSLSGHTVTVGAALPLTGEGYAPLGAEIRRGIELAQADVAKNGASINVVYEDAKGDFGTGPVNAATKLLNEDNVDVGITMIVEEAKPIAPLFTDHKTPLVIAWDSTLPILKSSDYVFSSGFSDEKAAETMAEYAYNTLHARRVAVLQHTEAWADIVAPAFIQKLQALGGTIIYHDSVDTSTTDYRTLIEKIKALHPDAIYFPLVPPTNAQFIIEARQLGLPGALLTGDAFTQDVIGQVGNKVAEGIYFTNLYSDEADRLTAEYKAKYKEDPFDINLVSLGYRAIEKIAESTQKPGTTLQEKMVAAFGPERTANLIEHIYKVTNGTPTLTTEPQTKTIPKGETARVAP